MLDLSGIGLFAFNFGGYFTIQEPEAEKKRGDWRMLEKSREAWRGRY